MHDAARVIIVCACKGDVPVLTLGETVMQSINRIRRRPGSRNKRRAVTVVMMAIGLVAVIGLCGLAVDVGHVCVARSELKRSADAGGDGRSGGDAGRF